MIFGGYEINSLNDIDIFLNDFIDDKIKFNDLFILIPYIYLFNNLKNFKTYKYIEQNFYLNLLYKFIVLLYYNKRKYKLLYFLNKKKDIKILYKNFLIDYLKITDDNLKNKKCKNIKNFFKKNKDYYLNYNTIEDIQYINDINIIKKDIDKFIKYLLNIYLYLCKIKKNRYTNDYIGLYQYNTPLCWFYSFLHCLCYSDLNKELVIEKLKENDNICIFKRNVKYIIENITKEFKKISDIDRKEELIDILDKIYSLEYILKILYKDIKKDLTDINKIYNYDKPNYNEYIFRILNSDNKEHRELLYFLIQERSNFIFNIIDGISGLTSYSEQIFVYLYNLLNIKAKFLYYFNNILYSFDDNDEDINEYDIILVKTIIDIKKLNLKEYPNIILKKEENRIYFKDNIYKLDCILSLSKYNKDKLVGHAISFINYNKKGYFINSDKFINDDKHKIINDFIDEPLDEIPAQTYYIPCFVKYNWLNNSFGKNINLCNDDKCNFKSYQYYKHSSEFCYSLDNNIYIFVKNNKLKSSSNIKKTTSSTKKYKNETI